LHDAARADSLAGNDVRVLAEDRDGSLWVGTRLTGLDRLDPASGAFAHFRSVPGDPHSLGGDAIYALIFDHRGRLWIGTTTGMSVRDPASGRFTRFTEKDGLPNDTIYAIREDASGRLWISTGRGLARFDPETKAFRNYDVSDGLQDNEFNGGAAWYAPASHNMYFGGVSGYNRFVPENIRDSEFHPPVVLTSFRVLGTPFPGVLESGSAQLTWRDSQISVEFAALDYSAPDKNRYGYMLQGLDHDWHYTQGQGTATYTNLSGGTYLLRVRGSNSDGVWSPQEARLTMTVTPPPWKRWWFIAIVALIGLAVVTWAYRARVARFRAAQAAQEAFSKTLLESQEAERKKIAAELHDSLGQNLIVIRNHALMAIAGSGDPQRTAGKLEEISSAASEAIEEVREIARSLHPQQLDRLGLTNALTSLVDRAAAASPIRFLAAIEPIDGRLSKEAEINLFRIVQESLNNILKHSQATEAGISAEADSNGIAIRIYDNGQGFDPKGLAPERRGMGLTGMSERARAMGARYSLESSPGRGAVIRLDFDLRHGKSVGPHR
jgi:signal transduction histidine kinase